VPPPASIHTRGAIRLATLKRNGVTIVGSAAVFAGVVLVGLLAGCAMSDDQMARFLVAPGKYTLYSCDEIAKETQAKAAREQELQQLMAKAGTDSGGRVIASIAYEPDYVTVRGELNDLREAAASKHCATTPGAGNRTGGAGNRAAQ
jgi:hypothetical protein